MKIIKTGVTRLVFLVGSYAIKIPRFYSYRHFLQGILANDQEAYWSSCFKHNEKLCPVLLTCPGRFFIVMPRVKVLTDAELDYGFPDGVDSFLRIVPDNESRFPGEKKSDSFGWLNGRLVIIDYGS